MTRLTQLVAVLALALVVAGGGVLAVTLTGSGAAQQQEAASVTIDDQPSDGQTVIVASVSVPEGGFVVIHDESLADGDAVDSVIGVSSYLEAGTHENVPVTVAPEFDTEDDIEVTAMAHQDTNDNEVFDFVLSDGDVDGAYLEGADQATETPTPTETPMGTETPTETPPGGEETPTETETPTPTETPMDGETPTETETPAETGTPTDGEEAGEPVTDTAVIDATGNQVPDTNLAFENQSTDGTTVTVQEVTLYRGGYVVIHDESLQEEGDAVGSVVGHSGYLAPGHYEDVEITLAEEVDFANDSEVTLIAMPHFETNQNLVYDFVTSLGLEDGPYLDQNDTAVVATATITEGAPETPTPAETPAETETPMDGETPAETEPGQETETPTPEGAT